jgi:hypothetical protein
MENPRKIIPAIITVIAPIGKSKSQPVTSPQIEKNAENRQLANIIPPRLLEKTPAQPAGRVSMAITITMPTKV